MRINYWRALSVLALAAALGTLGCTSRPKLVPVKGTVKLNGKPAEKILVEFIPDAKTGLRSTATTNANGEFTLRCDDQRPGAIVGVHRVVLSDVSVYGGKLWNRKAMNEAEAKGKEVTFKASRIPSQYGNVAQTPLKKEVKPEAQTIDLEISGAGK